MDSHQKTSEVFYETQSLQVIQEMIQVSKNKFKKDGLLFIVWGWALFYISLAGYLERSLVLSFRIKKILNFLEIVIPLAALAFTIYYLINQRKKVQTYIGISLRYVWISLFVSMVLVNLIQFNVLHSINFELQHPLFMVLMAFAVTVTGGILRFRMIILGGVVFGALALTASYMELHVQLIIESAAWALAFILPGHYLYNTREK